MFQSVRPMRRRYDDADAPGASFRRFFRTLDGMKVNGFGLVSLTVASGDTSTRAAFDNL